MINIGTLIATLRLQDKLTPALVKASNSLKSTGARLGKIGGQMKATGMSMTMGLTLPIVAGAGAMAVAFGSFEKSMNRVRALTGATGKDFEALKNQAKELGRTTKFSAGEAANAMGFLGMAGFKTTEILGAMPNVLELAAAATLDVASAADITSNIMTGFGQTTEDLAHTNNVLVKAFTSANTDLTQLGQAFKYAGPIAKSAGLSFESTAASLALMGNAGIQGSMAGTSLRGAITKLLGPTNKAAKEIRKLGLNAKDAEGNIRPMDEIVRQLESSSASTEQMITIFGLRAGPAMAALVGQGSDALQKMTGDLEGVGDIAAEIAETQMEGLAGSFTLFQSALTGAAIEMGEQLAPALTSLLELGIKVSNWISNTLVPAFTNLSPTVQAIILGTVAFVAALGPLLMILGQVAIGIGAVSTALGFLWTSALGPVGIGIAAITALFLAWKFIPKLVGWIGEKIDDLKHKFGLLSDAEYDAIVATRELNDSVEGITSTADDLRVALGVAGVEGTVEDLDEAMENLGSRVVFTDEELALIVKRAKELRAEGNELTPALARIVEKFDQTQAAAAAAAEAVEKDERQMKAAARAAAELAKETEALNEQIEKQVRIWERGAIPAAEEAIAAYIKFGDITKLTAAEQQALSGTLEEGLEKYRALGEEAPAAMRRVAGELRRLHTVIESRPLDLPVTFGDPAEMPGGWKQLAREFQAKVDAGIKGGIQIPVEMAVGLPPPPEMASFGQTVGRHFKGGFEGIVKGLPDTIVQAFKGGGGILGALGAVTTQIGSVVGGGFGSAIGAKLGAMAEGTKGMFGKFLGGLGDLAGPIGAAIGAMAPMIAGAFKRLFSGPTVQESVKRTISRTLGISISEGLADAIAKTKTRTRSDFGAMMIHISEVIEEGGGVITVGLISSIRAVRDIFSAVEMGAITTRQASTSFGKSFKLIADALVESGGIASKQFVELITLAQRFGTTAETIKFVGEQSKLAADGVAAMGASGVKTKEELEDLGTIAVASFEAALAAGMSFTEAVKAHGPALDMVIAQQEKLGVTSENVALQQLAEFRDRVNQNSTLVTAVEALDDTMLALARTGSLNAETMASLERQGLRMYTKLIAAGFSQQEAILQLGPSLRLIMEAHARLGIPIDANTQKLLDQAKEAGALEAQQKTGWAAVESAVMKVVSALERMISKLGGVRSGINAIPRNVSVRVNVTEQYNRANRQPFGPEGPGFQGGTQGKYLDFGTGTPTMLHGNERIMTAAEGKAEAGGFAVLDKRLERIEQLLKKQPRAVGLAISDSLTLMN